MMAVPVREACKSLSERFKLRGRKSAGFVRPGTVVHDTVLASKLSFAPGRGHGPGSQITEAVTTYTAIIIKYKMVCSVPFGGVFSFSISGRIRASKSNLVLN
jgi:hypothetical protein